ncbi:MAG: MCE family protein [Candidatus Omnitrophica bacterium]|nr:MCE family protein [Candidatus Omnitrophota bacterium]
MATKQSLELKVGIFALVGLAILILTVFSISEIHLFRPGYLIKVSFSFASGIDVGATARVAGIEAGEVKDVHLSYDKNRAESKVTLLVWLDKDVKIPRDSQAYVNVLGLIGETYLEIVPGEDYAHLLKEGDILVGRDPLSPETLMEIVHKVSADLDGVLGSLNEVLDEETKEALKETVHNFRDFSESLKVITGRLERGEGKLGTWLMPPKSRSKSKR